MKKEKEIKEHGREQRQKRLKEDPLIRNRRERTKKKVKEKSEKIERGKKKRKEKKRDDYQY